MATEHATPPADAPAPAPVGPAATPPVSAPVAPPIDPGAPPGALTDAPAAPAAPGAEPAKDAAPAIPETYAFEPPVLDGKPIALDPEMVSSFEASARAAGLTQAQFQALGETGAQMIAAQVAKASGAPLAVWHETQKAWQAEVKADPVFGGAKLPETLGYAAAAIDRLGGDGLRSALNVTGAGNNPAMVRAFAEMGKMLSDPSSLSTGKPAGAARNKSGEQIARDLYNAGGGNYPDVQA